ATLFPCRALFRSELAPARAASPGLGGSPREPVRAARSAASMLPVVGAALRPRATAAIAGRSFATQTMRGLRSLTETQLPSVRVSPTQDGLSAPATMGSWGTTAANGARLGAGVVSAMDASSARVTASANLGLSAVALIAAPGPPA